MSGPCVEIHVRRGRALLLPLFSILILTLSVVFAGCGSASDDDDASDGGDETSSPEPGETPTLEPGETPTPEPGETPTPEPVESPTPEPGESPTPEPGESPTPEPGETPTPEPGESPTPAVTDGDGDGSLSPADCDDTDPAIHPGAVESCDSKDNDCDGTVDEGLRTSWYPDLDGDSYGSEQGEVVACTCPTGYVAVAGDCDDRDASSHPDAADPCDGKDNDCDGSRDEGSIYYYDADQDGYGTTSNAVTACSQPVGYVTRGGDCDDNDPARNPGATEVCDGKDNDCDGTPDDGAKQTWYLDADGDSYGRGDVSVQACPQPMGYVARAGDCNDSDRNSYPGAVEVCDSRDNDCDGTADEGLEGQVYYQDGDGDGYGDPESSRTACGRPDGYSTDDTDCDDGDAAVNPGATEVCDGKDNDCDLLEDELVWRRYYRDADGDGFGVESDTYTGCSAKTGYVRYRGDCNDNEKRRYPGATDAGNDGIDQDCGGTVGPDPHVGLPGSVHSLSTAVAAAQAGNIIWVGPAVYREVPADFGGKPLTLAAVDPSPSMAIIEAGIVGMPAFVFLSGEGPDTVVDGFTFDGEAGNAIEIFSSSPMIRGCTFLDRVAAYSYGRGAAILLNDSGATITGCTFAGNTADNGGAIFAQASSPSITRCTFLENMALPVASEDAYGGAVTFENSTNVLIEDSLFAYNEAGAGGGAIDLYISSGTIQGCTFLGNVGEVGGGIALYKSASIVSNCRFVANRAASGMGGGLNISTSVGPLIRNCLFEENEAATYGGGINMSNGSSPTITNCTVRGNRAVRSGGGINIGSSSPVVTHCTIVDNEAANGGGVTVFGAISAPVIQSSILAYNSLYNLYNDEVQPGSPTVTYSDLFNPAGVASHNLASLDGSNLTLEPGFLAWEPDSGATNLHLGKTSPLINKGVSTGRDPDGTVADPGSYGGALGDDWDLDGDGYPDWFWPGPISSPPAGFEAEEFDCDDLNPSVAVCK